MHVLPRPQHRCPRGTAVRRELSTPDSTPCRFRFSLQPVAHLRGVLAGATTRTKVAYPVSSRRACPGESRFARALACPLSPWPILAFAFQSGADDDDTIGHEESGPACVSQSHQRQSSARYAGDRSGWKIPPVMLKASRFTNSATPLKLSRHCAMCQRNQSPRDIRRPFLTVLALGFRI